MSLQLRPLAKDDYEYLYNSPVASETEIKEFNNDAHRERYKKDLSKCHVRQWIHLKLPVLNTAVCGSGNEYLAKLLGVKRNEIEDILAGTTAISKDDGRFYSGSDVSGMASDWYVCAQAIEYLIQNMNVYNEVVGRLNRVLNKSVPDNCVYEVNQKPGGLKYYADFNVHFKEANSYSKDYVLAYRNKIIESGGFTRIDMFINLLHAFDNDPNKVKDYLLSVLFLRNMTLLPFSLRPSKDRNQHPTTIAYSQLFNHNSNYSIYSSGDVDGFKGYYTRLQDIVDAINVDNRLKGSQELIRNCVPVMSTMGGKTGSLRARFLKKRQDYSGRSVVVINPNLSVDTIGIPKSMVPKLYRRYTLSDTRIKPKELLEKIDDSKFEKFIVETLEKEGVISRIPVLLGRNPTLHKWGIQGFRVVLVDGRAIQVNPLVCPAFNMDFDGDTAHTEIPMTFEAEQEVRDLIMTDKNIILSKTGECTICPRMDIIYGLYMSTLNEYPESGKSACSYNTPEELWHAIKMQKAMVWDTVSLSGWGTGYAGRLAVKSCFPKSIWDEFGDIEEITSDSIKKYIEVLATYPRVQFDNTINNLVRYGFTAAYIYSRSVSMLQELNKCEEFDSAIDNFHESMKEIDELNDLGFFDEDSYSVEYGRKAEMVEKAYKANIWNKVRPSNMFYLMAKSGARGNAGNLVQMFGNKGRIQRSDSESFNVIIENGLHDMLTPMEHGIAANGARKGQIAKSIKTAATGYLGRKMAHVAASTIIREHDCGTDKGIEISRSMIENYFYSASKKSEDLQKQYTKVFARLIEGRCEAGTNHIISKKEAKAIADNVKVKSVKIRSPLTCNNPCCQLCYGNDVETGRLPVVGKAVGIIAAQSLSEPSTQMTMKEFQKGGVAGAASSPFDRLDAILNQMDIHERARDSAYPMYDPIAWAPGKLVQEQAPGNTVLLRIEPENAEDEAKYDYKSKRQAPGGVAYKVDKHVNVGDNLRVERGDSYIQEVIKYCGANRAQLELFMTLYRLFVGQLDIVPVHIEIIVSNMVGYMPITSNLRNIKMGKSYKKSQLITLAEDYSGTEFKVTIRGVSNCVTNNVNFMEALIFEKQRKVLADAVLNGAVDMMDSPLVQMAFGQRPKLGTGYNENYREG